ncbi:MAG: serine hydrolase [Candidatus Paceibacterota bacterium]
MDLKWQATIFIVLILVSLTLTKLGNSFVPGEIDNSIDYNAEEKEVSFQEAAISNYQPIKKVPNRVWDVLDPNIQAEAVLIRSLDDDFPLFYMNTRDSWRMASITKLLTTLVVLEEIGLDKKIPISTSAVETEGLAGDLQSGEVYNSRDLIKMMLLVSSNDAAAAFEEYFGGKEILVKKLKEKAAELGMNSTEIHDASGLSDDNFSTANDVLKLAEYIVKNRPEIFNWTRSSEILVQPFNSAQGKIIPNINPLVVNRNFLGGKTGTAPLAKENLVSIMNIRDRKVAIIILGADDRYLENEKLVNWVKRAYIFNN